MSVAVAAPAVKALPSWVSGFHNLPTSRLPPFLRFETGDVATRASLYKDGLEACPCARLLLRDNDHNHDRHSDDSSRGCPNGSSEERHASGSAKKPRLDLRGEDEASADAATTAINNGATATTAAAPVDTAALYKLRLIGNLGPAAMQQLSFVDKLQLVHCTPMADALRAAFMPVAPVTAGQESGGASGANGVSGASGSGTPAVQLLESDLVTIATTTPDLAEGLVFEWLETRAGGGLYSLFERVVFGGCDEESLDPAPQIGDQ